MKRITIGNLARVALLSAALFGEATFRQTNLFGQTPADLPSAAAVLQHYVDATGGKAAYDTLKSELSSGTFSVASTGIGGTVKEYAAAPARAYAVMEIPGVGKLEGGTDGKIAWENSALLGARLLTGDEAAAALRKASVDVATNWRKYYKAMEVTGTEVIDGKTCYRMTKTPLSGAVETDYYDKESGLLVKSTATEQTPMGPVPSETSLSDYRKQGNLLLPFHIQQKMAGQQFDIKLEKIDLNVDIPDSRFDPPSEIKALQK